MNINEQFMKKYYSSRNGRKIEWIVVHYTGSVWADGRAQVISNSLHRLEENVDTPANKKRSTHYIIGDDKIIQCVEDNKSAWHVGKYKSGYRVKCENANSIGVDLVEYKVNKKSGKANDNDWYFSNTTLNEGANIIAQLMKRHSIDIEHVVRHYDITGKICPAPFVGDSTNEKTGEIQKFQWLIFKELIKIYFERNQDCVN